MRDEAKQEEELVREAMACLLERLGIPGTERFLAYVRRDHFDYAKWRREQFEELSLHELNEAAAAYVREFSGGETQSASLFPVQAASV